MFLFDFIKSRDCQKQPSTQTNHQAYHQISAELKDIQICIIDIDKNQRRSCHLSFDQQYSQLKISYDTASAADFNSEKSTQTLFTLPSAIAIEVSSIRSIHQNNKLLVVEFRTKTKQTKLNIEFDTQNSAQMWKQKLLIAMKQKECIQNQTRRVKEDRNQKRWYDKLKNIFRADKKAQQHVEDSVQIQQKQENILSRQKQMLQAATYLKLQVQQQQPNKEQLKQVSQPHIRQKSNEMSINSNQTLCDKFKRCCLHTVEVLKQPVQVYFGIPIISWIQQACTMINEALKVRKLLTHQNIKIYNPKPQNKLISCFKTFSNIFQFIEKHGQTISDSCFKLCLDYIFQRNPLFAKMVQQSGIPKPTTHNPKQDSNFEINQEYIHESQMELSQSSIKLDQGYLSSQQDRSIDILSQTSRSQYHAHNSLQNSIRIVEEVSFDKEYIPPQCSKQSSLASLLNSSWWNPSQRLHVSIQQQQSEQTQQISNLVNASMQSFNIFYQDQLQLYLQNMLQYRLHNYD